MEFLDVKLRYTNTGFVQKTYEYKIVSLESNVEDGTMTREEVKSRYVRAITSLIGEYHSYKNMEVINFKELHVPKIFKFVGSSHAYRQGKGLEAFFN